jgi:methyl-accepting chemotaxis protein
MSLFRRMSLRAKIVMTGFLLTVALTLVLFVLYAANARQQAVGAIVEKAKAINLMAESARMEMEDKLASGLITDQMMREWAKKGENEKILGAVPVVTAWRSAMRKAAEAGYTFKVPKLQPRNPKNAPDELEGRVIRKMESERLEEHWEIDPAKNAVRTFRAVRLTEVCLMCHGDPGLSHKYWGNDQGVDPFGVRLEGWKAGEVHGAFEIIQSLDQADREIRGSLIWGGLVVLVGLIVSGGLFFIMITGAVNRPIERISTDLVDSSDQVASASSEISATSQSLADGASNQAASLEETSASLEELSSMTRQNADHATEANKLMGETRGIVERAGRSMDQMTESMSEISEAGREIGKIIKTIDEIAFQTNLLALNAAVEAARAGEAGAGFAVVADEVRNLAQRSAEAARNTGALIEGAIRKIAQGTHLVAEATEAFREVNQAAHKVADLVGDVAGASTEQAQGIDQINQAVANLDKVIQQNAAQAEESAAASEELGSQAEALRQVVDDLMGIIHGRKTDD